MLFGLKKKNTITERLSEVNKLNAPPLYSQLEYNREQGMTPEVPKGPTKVNRGSW